MAVCLALRPHRRPRRRPCRRAPRPGRRAMRDPVVVGVPVDGLLDVAGAQLGQDARALRGRLGGRSRSRMCTPPAVAGDEGFEGAARADRAELAVIADHDHLGPGRLGGGQQAQHGGVVGHARLVADHHRAVVEVQAVRGRSATAARPWCGTRRCRLRGPGCGPPGRRWRCRSPGSRRSRTRRGPRPGRWSCPAPATPDDQLDAPPGGAHRGRSCARCPAVSGRPPSCVFFGGDRRVDARCGATAGASSRSRLQGDFDGDGGLVGDHTGGGVGLLPGRGDTDQRDRRRGGRRPLRRPGAARGVAAEQQRGRPPRSRRRG